MDGAERHPGAVAEVSCVSGRLHRHWNRGRALDAGRDLPADAAGDPVRGVAVVRCHKTGELSHGVNIHREIEIETDCLVRSSDSTPRRGRRRISLGLACRPPIYRIHRSF
jgi:hypothetical protein